MGRSDGPKNGRAIPPDGIILTVGAKMYGETGYRNWLSNFLHAMELGASGEDMFYWFKAGAQPKNDKDIRFVYLVIGGKIRYRCIYAGSRGAGAMQFQNHNLPMEGKAWILASGPAIRAPRKFVMKGFQGFRYTEEIF